MVADVARGGQDAEHLALHIFERRDVNRKKSKEHSQPLPNVARHMMF
jgi:hypothetical protein